MRIEAQVRKRKQATDHRKAEIKEMLITVVIVAGLGWHRWPGALGFHSMGRRNSNERIYPRQESLPIQPPPHGVGGFGMMIVCTGAVIIDPARMAQADAS
jgi:hypothetical protein